MLEEIMEEKVRGGRANRHKQEIEGEPVESLSHKWHLSPGEIKQVFKGLKVTPPQLTYNKGGLEIPITLSKTLHLYSAQVTVKDTLLKSVLFLISQPFPVVWGLTKCLHLKDAINSTTFPRKMQYACRFFKNPFNSEQLICKETPPFLLVSE